MAQPSASQDLEGRIQHQKADRAEEWTRWTVVGAASAILFIGVGYTNTFGVFQTYYQNTLFPEVSAEKLIVIGSVAASLYFTLGAFCGRFADLVGYRVSLSLGSALMIGSLFVASVSTKYWQIFLTQGLMFGLGLAFVYPPATAISRQYFPQSHGLANGVVVSGGALGGCILPFCVQRMITDMGLSATFRTLGYIAIGVLVPSVVLLRPKASSLRYSRGPILDLTLLKDQRFLWLLTACTVAMTGFLPRYLLVPSSAVSKGIDPTYSSWLLGLMNGLSIIGRVGIGYLSNRFGKTSSLAASFLLCGTGHLMFWLPGVTLSSHETDKAIALFTLFVVYTGILGSGFISLFPVVVADLFGHENLASKTGLLNSAVGLTTLAGPSIVYAIIGTGAHRRWSLGVVVAGVFMVAGSLVLWAMKWPEIKARRSEPGSSRNGDIHTVVQS